MAKADNGNRRPGRSRPNKSPAPPASGAKKQSAMAAGQETDGPDSTPGARRKWSAKIRSANKAILAAIGAGIIGAITAGVLEVPKLIANVANPTSLLTVDGTATPWPREQPSRDTASTAGPGPMVDTDPVENSEPCSFGGDYILPAGYEFQRTLTTDALEATLRDAVYADGESGSYVLQAATGQTVVVTGIHTELISRKPAARATRLHIYSPCSACLDYPDYAAEVDLDTNKLVPRLSVTVPDNQLCFEPRRKAVQRIRATVTDGSPLLIDVSASTTMYEVVFKIRIDYSVAGKTKSVWIPRGNRPSHVIADRYDNDRVGLRYRYDKKYWEVVPF